jgi:nucleoside-diphosphate-sugar epimerase
VDILDKSNLEKSFYEFQPEYVIHLAAKTDLDGKTLSDYSANIDGVQNIINCVNNCDSVEKVIYTSSRLVFDISHKPVHNLDYNASTIYGQSKVKGELAVLSQDSFNAKPWMILRPTSIWGEWFGIPYKNFFDSVISGRYVHPSGTSIQKSFGYVGNIVHQYLHYLSLDDHLFNRKILFATDFEPLDLLDFANAIRKQSNFSDVKQIKSSALKMGGYLGDLLKKFGYKNPPLTTFRYNNLITNMIYPTDRERALCGNLPYDQEAGIENTLNWMRENS